MAHAPHFNSSARPALFDLQVNGFDGVDFQQPGIQQKDFRRALESLRRHHVHGLLVTLITAPIEQLLNQLDRIESFCVLDPLAGAMVAGYHLEGPYLNPTPGYRGAHPPDAMHAPDVRELSRLIEASRSRLRLLTLAPELPGSTDLIAAARQQKIVISLGHTDASEAEIDRAITAGATLCTHLGNGVPGMLPRHDNVIQRLLARDELTACFIPDGHHLPPQVLRNFYRAKPAHKVMLTSDAMAAAGAGPGRYTIGQIETEVGKDGIVRLPHSGHFAGSSLTLDQGVENAARWLGLAPEHAWALASTTPAAHFGLTLPTLTYPTNA